MKAGYKVLGLLACIVVIATIVVWRLVLPDDDANAMGGVGSPPKDAPAVNDGIASVTSAKKEWQKLDDPAADGWDSEVLNAAFKKQLDELSERIVSGELSAESLASIVATDFRGTHLVPTSLTGVFDSNGIQVRRGTPSKKLEFSGVAGLEESLQELRASLGSEDGKLRCKFKVIGIRADGEQAVSRQLVECARIGVSGRSEQHSEWTIEWRVSDEGSDARIAAVRVDRFEQSSAPKSLFSDCTESVLGSCQSFQDQLLFGATHWLPRIQDTRQMIMLGTPGTALGDVNGDGLDDLYLCQARGLPNRLFLQNPDGTLRDATMESGTGWVESSRAALLVDLDNDGDQDLAVATYARLVLARNDGSGRFEVMTVLETGIGSMGISATDFDNDRDLDLYVCHYSRGDLDLEAGATVIGSGGRFVYHDANNAGRNYFFRNEIEGEEWKLQDVTEESGLDVNNRRFSLAAAWEDFDNDGDQDLYVANDFGRNNLFRNEGGHFTDIAATVQGEDRASGMSVSWGDVNRDGRMDLY
ncbi:MAG TPA: VCBS repeat-containing protein, partial [Roseibacillus sp.]|nr:VCBS repeat-containing protein [Roseibacillus sp.]